MADAVKKLFRIHFTGSGDCQKNFVETCFRTKSKGIHSKIPFIIFAILKKNILIEKIFLDSEHCLLFVGREFLLYESHYLNSFNSDELAISIIYQISEKTLQILLQNYCCFLSKKFICIIFNFLPSSKFIWIRVHFISYFMKISFIIKTNLQKFPVFIWTTLLEFFSMRHIFDVLKTSVVYTSSWSPWHGEFQVDYRVKLKFPL